MKRFMKLSEAQITVFYRFMDEFHPDLRDICEVANQLLPTIIEGRNSPRLTFEIMDESQIIGIGNSKGDYERLF